MNEKNDIEKIESYLETLSPTERLRFIENLGKKPKKNKIFRFFFYIFALNLLLISSIVLYGIYKFTPLYSYNSDQGRLTILGGLIDLNQQTGEYKIFNDYHYSQKQFSNSFDGSLDITRDEVDEVHVEFLNGLMEFKTSSDDKVIFSCKLENPPDEALINQENPSVVEIDFTKMGGSTCTMEIPRDLKFTLNGKNGQVTLNEPLFDSFVEMQNGRILINPNSEIDYKYNLENENGMIDDFTSSRSSQAYEIKATLQNGAIINQNK